MLIRSKRAKLTIRSGYSLAESEPKTIEIVRLCLYEMSRVEEINLSEIRELLALEKIFRDLPKSAPQLHTLCIRLFSGAAGFSIDEDFLYDTERLRSVELINCKISWDSRLLTGLTCLTLKDSLKANSSIIQLLNAFRRMPALSYLLLDDSIPDDSGGPSTYDVVDFPFLQELNISSGVGALTTFLRHISFPHSTILDLICKENQSSTEIDFSKFLPILASKFLSSLVIRSLRVGYPDDIDEPEGLEFYLWTTALIPSLPIPESPLHLVFTWFSSHPRDYINALTCAFDTMSLSFLTQLRISIPIDSLALIKTFGKLPLLERVYLEGFSSQGFSSHTFFEALVYKSEEAEKSKTAYRNVSFPKLRYIHLVGGFIENETTIDRLLDCLMERYERNAEVEAICLEDCYSTFSSNEVERIKEVVVDVIWDGRVHNWWG